MRSRAGWVPVAVLLAVSLVGCGSAKQTTSTTATLSAATSTAKTTPAPTTTTPKPKRKPKPKPKPMAKPPKAVPKPHIVWNPIPFGPARKAQMVAYVRRHYGSFLKPTWRLINPHVIVIHFTDTPDFQSTWNTFASDQPDPELHELPGTCAHFVVDQHGTIHQLVSLGTMCRHTVGLNWTAIGIEHVGYSDAQVLNDHAQITASLKLVHWLRCRFHIKIRNVIGHNESLASPYHHEDVPSLRTQTHSDFNHADMDVYRARLRKAGACPTTT